jgi:large subunit ribosomal protein L16
MGINKYKKYHKIKTTKNEKYNLRPIKKGFFGIKVLESGIITPKQLYTAKTIISRINKKTSKIFLNVICNHPITKKPLLSRMGKGSGNINK